MDYIKGNSVVKFFANLKVAVVVILVFTSLMIFGTFQESYHGTEYANRFVYKNWYFILSQLFLFGSVLCAALLRLPPKPRLYGFYTIHTGILVMGIGSLITHLIGIDGSIQLDPNTPTSSIVEPKDYLFIQKGNEKTFQQIPLPSYYREKNLNLTAHGLKITNYIPFGFEKLTWETGEALWPSIFFSISNQFVKERVVLSRHPTSNYPNRMSLGPLTITYLPKIALPCFSKVVNQEFILNSLNGECIPVSDSKIERSLGINGEAMVIFKDKENTFTFFPHISSRPLNEKRSIVKNSPFEIFSAGATGPSLFIFETTAAYFQKGVFTTQELSVGNAITLPWMNIQLIPHKMETNTYPIIEPAYTVPIQEDGKIVQGELKAVRVENGTDKKWIVSGNTQMFETSEGKVSVSLNSKIIQLPYQFTLDQFKMNKYPGTELPASYESFVRVSDENDVKHIYMNNPLKKDGLTFYQSSYYPVGPESFGSILSVNYDPGRLFKYLGSILLVFGAIWHFYITRAKEVKTHA